MRQSLAVNVSAAARDGIATAVRSALTQNDRAAYPTRPEMVDEFWGNAEARDE